MPQSKLKPASIARTKASPIGVVVLILGLVTCSLAPAAPAPARVAFEADFDAPDALTGWSIPPQRMTLSKGRTGSGLYVSQTAGEKPGTVIGSVSLPVERLRGCRVRCEASVRATNVLQPPKPWNGIKLMVHTDSASEGPRWDQQNSVFGTFDWRTIRFTTTIPNDASLAQLLLGIENSSGQAWFDDVKITLLRDPRDHVLTPAASGPVFKGHALPRLRGTMVQPDISPESLRVLGSEWKANAIRWQLIQYVPAGREPSLAQYDSWLEGELTKLDRLLPVCVESGVRVVVDLHSPPGGARTSSGYIGSDAGLFTNSAAQAKFVAVWRKIAHRYRDSTIIWGYDLANEPVEEEVGDGCEDWQQLATRAAQAIREIDSTHAIIVEPSPWGSPSSILNLDPLPVAGVVYSVHMYVPHQFTHQGIQGNAAGLRYPGPIAGREYDKAALRRVLQPMIDFQRRHHAHVFLGEFSAIRWAPGAADYLRDCVDLFEENGWDWTYHAFREYHGWSVEHGADPANHERSPTPTDRQRVLLDWFAKNVKP